MRAGCWQGMPAKKRRTEFTWRAEREYLAELRYLLLQEASVAFAVQDRIEAALERLARYPCIAPFGACHRDAGNAGRPNALYAGRV